MLRQVVFVFMLLLVKVVGAQTPAKAIPPATFYKLNGQAFSTREIPANKPCLFSFFDISCSHCKLTIQYLAEHHSKLSDVTVYLVTLDRKDAVVDFLNKFGKPLTYKTNVIILQDLKLEFIQKFQPDKYPAVFLYDKYQKLVLYIHDEKKMSTVIERLKSLN